MGPLIGHQCGRLAKVPQIDPESSTNISSWTKSNVWCPRAAAAMILSGLAFQRNGFGSVLLSATYRLLPACRSTTPTKATRLRFRLVSAGEETLNRVQPWSVAAGNWGLMDVLVFDEQER
jgi:hypothetical protein